MNERSETTDARFELRSGMALRRIVGRSEPRGGVDLEPGCAYGVVTRTMVEDLYQELRAIRTRVDSLFGVVIGAVALDLLLRLAGIG